MAAKKIAKKSAGLFQSGTSVNPVLKKNDAYRAQFKRYADLDWTSFSELIRQKLTAFDKTIGEASKELGWAPGLVQVALRGSSLRDVRVDQLIGYLSIEPSDLPKINQTHGKHQGSSIFISYSHRDQDYLERLMIHLKPLAKRGAIDPWVDTRLKIGDKWKNEIQIALKKASVGILLVSADFLASDFIIDDELPPLLRAAEEKGTLILPIIVRPCRFSRDPSLNIFQAANSPDEPLSALEENEREFVYDNVSRRIEESLPVEK